MAEGQAKLAEAVEEMRRHLRESFAALVAHLRDRLAPDPLTGQRKTIRAASVQGLLEFLDVFAARNSVAQDVDLAALVEQARGLLAGVEAPDLRSDDALRQALHTGLSAVAARLDQLIETPPGRRYELLDEENAL